MTFGYRWFLLFSSCYFEDLIVFAEGEELYFFVSEVVQVKCEFDDTDHSILGLLGYFDPHLPIYLLSTSFSSAW